MKKNQMRGLLALGIVLVVYSIAVFVLPFDKGGEFWLSYIFALISLVVCGIALYLGVGKDDARSKLYGFPIARIGVIYAGLQLVASLVFICVGKWVPIWIPVVLYAIGLGVAALGLIATDAVRDEIERQDIKLKKDVALMRTLQSKARTLPTLCSDKTLAEDLGKLSDELKYSDPVSSEAIETAEEELSFLLDELQKAVVDGDDSSATVLCRKTRASLAERNRLCKLNKK